MFSCDSAWNGETMLDGRTQERLRVDMGEVATSHVVSAADPGIGGSHKLDDWLREVSSLVSPRDGVDRMVQPCKVAAEDELHLRDAANVATTPIWSDSGVHFVQTNTVSCAQIEWKFGEEDFSRMAERCSLKTVWNKPYGKEKKATRKRIIFKVPTEKRRKAHVRLWLSGKMVCLAAATKKEAFAALRKVAEDISSIGSELIGCSHPTVENIVGTVALGYEVDFHSLVEDLNSLVEGEAAIEDNSNRCVQYKQRLQGNRKVTLRIFSTGKINLFGARTEDDVRAVLDTVQPALQRARLLP
jgi:TATA-box binding protein (TBP) (component of TFIID and TFIIIB)